MTFQPNKQKMSEIFGYRNTGLHISNGRELNKFGSRAGNRSAGLSRSPVPGETACLLDEMPDKSVYDAGKQNGLAGELVKNNNFAHWASYQNLQAWLGYNFIKTEDAYTDDFAVSLGNNPHNASQLFQDIQIYPGNFFELKFALKLPEPLLENPTVRVIWLDREQNPLATGLSMRISKRKKEVYSLYARVTSRSPDQTVYARLLFEKEGYGVVNIDEVSFICR